MQMADNYLDVLPFEILVKILELSVGKHIEMLKTVRKTCNKWNNITENVCFWQPIFGKLILLNTFNYFTNLLNFRTEHLRLKL
jgi:hypothetical protein